jgi:hypothetical protein
MIRSSAASAGRRAASTGASTCGKNSGHPSNDQRPGAALARRRLKARGHHREPAVYVPSASNAVTVQTLNGRCHPWDLAEPHASASMCMLFSVRHMCP